MAEQQVSMTSDEATCVLIPVGAQMLLLPNVTVAEILSWRRTKAFDGQPDWCAGLVGWRGLTLPVIRYPVLNDMAAADVDQGRCILVMNRVRSPKGKPFYGLIANGLPRLVHLGEGDVVNNRVGLGPAETASVKVGTEVAVIPSLELIEDKLASLPSL
jgi:chemosensory pili system protein ChpC